MHFEDFAVWKSARKLTNDIYKVTNNKEFAKDYCLRDQIRRAAVSVMSNIAKGYEREGSQEFVQFLLIAKSRTVFAGDPSGEQTFTATVGGST